MNQPHFYTILSSRLGLRFAPIGHATPNIGVEEGGAAILACLETSAADESSILRLDFESPESLAGETYLAEVFQRYAEAVSKLLAKWDRKKQLISLGGDHSSAYISLAAVLEVYGEENVGVLMVDSHADLHLPETSPTGNFHGMWLRPFFDGFAQYQLQNKRLRPDQLRFVGNLLIEEEEARFLTENHVPTYPSTKITPATVTELLTWAKSFPHLHISFDIDVFAEALVAATGTANPNGFQEPEIFAVLEALKTHPSISLDIVEFNPKKAGAEDTLKIIEKVYTKILKFD